MNEMLGNQYFLSRNYSKAASIYSDVHSRDPLNDIISRRLIICFTQTGELSKAFDIFYNLIKRDITIITNIDPIAEDCPCPELTKHYGSIIPYEKNSRDLNLMLAMLWLFCDAKKSLQFFNQLLILDEGNSDLEEVTKIISNHINSTNIKHN